MSPKHIGCPKCRHPEFKIGKASPRKRPEFTCTSCGNRWTYGDDGGPYMNSKFAKNLEKKDNTFRN